MKILAMSRFLPGGSMEAVGPHMHEETMRGWELYKSGIIREWYFRTDQPGAVLIMECADVDEAKKHLATSPLAKAGLIGFDLYPLGAYVPLEVLFASAPRA